MPGALKKERMSTVGIRSFDFYEISTAKL